MKTINEYWDEFYLRVFVEQNVSAEHLFKHILSEVNTDARLDGMIEGLQRYAWWKDGTLYVETCGMTFNEAIRKAKETSHEAD